MKRISFSKKIARVFDDNLKTRQWENIIDYTIIGLIIISSIEVFLSTFPDISDKYGHILHFVDVFTTIVFTIEVTLRIWFADALDEKYKGFKGRLKYCFSFYGIIDILSTYPFYLNFIMPVPYNALKILRIARLFRVFRYMKSFRLLSNAISSKKSELLISFQFLAITTIILSFILFFVEHTAQPEVYANGVYPMVWAFAQYIGDPGGFAEYPPVTFAGRLIACIVGILGIAIFAVPAGLVGSGFMEVIENDRKVEKDKANVEKLRERFKFTQCRYTKFIRTPQYVSLATIQEKTLMTTDDIFDAIASSEEFRLKNLAKTRPIEERPNDKLVVEHFLLNRPYGGMIDRKSKVTIVSTSSTSEVSTGHVAYYLAKIGGFNYISKEIANKDKEDGTGVSYYNIPDDLNSENFKLFMSDLNKLSSSPDSWVIFLLSASGGEEPVYPTQFHYIIGGKKGEVDYSDPNLTVKDTATFEAMYKELSEKIKEAFDLESDVQQYHAGTSPKNIARHLGTPDMRPNAFTIRIAWSVTCWDYRITAISKEMADIINKHIEPEKEKTVSTELTTRVTGKDYGYKFYKE